MASSGGLPMRGLVSAAPQCEGRGGGDTPGCRAQAPGLKEHPGLSLARRAAPLSLSQPCLNSCFTRSAFPIHWEKINKSNPQDLSLITSRLYLGLQLSCALLLSPSGRHATASNKPSSLSSEERDPSERIQPPRSLFFNSTQPVSCVSSGKDQFSLTDYG